MASEAAAVRRPGLDPRKLTWLLVVVGLAALVAVLAVAARTGAIGRGNLVYDVLVDPFVLMAQAPDLLVQTLWEGLVSGVLYALIALGFVLIFKASGVFNFAQGIMVVFAALTLVGLHEKGVPALARAHPHDRRDARARDRGRARRAAAARQPARHHPVHGDLRADLLPHRPRRADLRRQPEADDLASQLYLPQGATDVEILGGRVRFQHIDIAAAVIASLMIAALARVLLEDPHRAGARGPSPTATRRRSRSASRSNQIWVIVWFTAGIVALVTGIMWGARSDVSFALQIIALKALPVLILGGFTSIPGAIVGGLIIGVGEKIGEFYWGPLLGGGIETWLAYMIALLFLLYRPQGLFGEKIIERV